MLFVLEHAHVRAMEIAVRAGAAGQGGTLLVEGLAGVGKTTVLLHAIDAASDDTLVLRASGTGLARGRAH